MASEPTARRDSPNHVLSWATIVLLGAVVIGALVWRPSLASPTPSPTNSGLGGPAAPAVASPAPLDVALTSIPLPDSSFSGKVVDPSTFVEGAIVPADVAVDAAGARAPHLVGAEPLVRLMEVTNNGGPTESERLDGLYWVILSPDATEWVSGTYLDTPDEEFTFYGWVFVDMKGEVVWVGSNGYPKGLMTPPALPDR